MPIPRAIPVQYTEPIVNAYKSGTRTRELANQYNVSKRCIHRLLLNNGISKIRNEHVRKISPDQHQNICELFYNKGMTQTAIAQLYNVNKQTISVIVNTTIWTKA